MVVGGKGVAIPLEDGGGVAQGGGALMTLGRMEVITSSVMFFWLGRKKWRLAAPIGTFPVSFTNTLPSN